MEWPTGSYGTIVIDSPWRFDDQGGRTATPYQSMPDKAIVSLPVGALARPEGAHLYSWTTDAHLETACRAARAWGFRIVSTIVWVKLTQHRDRLRWGGGHYLRHAHELCLFGVKGRALGASRSEPSVIIAEPRGPHSAKPEALQDLAERLSPGPRIELFARRRRAGWVCWGNELSEA